MPNVRYHDSFASFCHLLMFFFVHLYLATKVFGQPFQFVNALNECLIILPDHDECGHSLVTPDTAVPIK